MTKPKPYSEIRAWRNVSQLTVTIGSKTVAPGGTFQGEAPRLMIRAGILRPKPPAKPKGAKKR